ncbi:hypothetical protein HQ544_04760 [Candidatus Falkowbacteria bacterium]|nr:hypothetical protein [Candidatus Falkowbacteria bacterium]
MRMAILLVVISLLGCAGSGQLRTVSDPFPQIREESFPVRIDLKNQAARYLDQSREDVWEQAMQQVIVLDINTNSFGADEEDLFWWVLFLQELKFTKGTYRERVLGMALKRYRGTRLEEDRIEYLEDLDFESQLEEEDSSIRPAGLDPLY